MFRKVTFRNMKGRLLNKAPCPDAFQTNVKLYPFPTKSR